MALIIKSEKCNIYLHASQIDIDAHIFYILCINVGIPQFSLD